MKVRFLLPFGIFFSLLCVTLAVVYYLRGVQLQMTAEQAQLETHLNHNVGASAKYLLAQIKRLDESVTGYHHAEPFSLPAASSPGEMEQLSRWLGARTNALRQVVTIKSQQPNGFDGLGAVSLAEQKSRTDTLLQQLGDSSASGGISSELSSIRTSFNQYDALVSRRNLLNKDRVDAEQAIGAAYDACIRAIAQMTQEGEALARDELVAMKTLVELSSLLFFNGTHLVRREFRGNGDASEKIQWDSIDDWRPQRSWTMEVEDVSLDYLVTDYYRDVAYRQFTTDPAYLASATLEDVIVNQDLLIETLLRVNSSLELRYRQLRFEGGVEDGRRWIDAIAGRQAATSGQITSTTTNAEATAEGTLRHQQEVLGNETSAVNAQRQGAQDALNVAVETHALTGMDQQKQRMELLITRHAETRRTLQNAFVDLRRASKRSLIALTHTGGDGEIMYADNVAQIFNIDLGSSDNVELGMRFVVYDDTGGEINIKAVIEVINVTGRHFATCVRVTQALGLTADDIQKNDKIENRLYENGRFLDVGLIGDFRPPRTRIYEAELVQRLLGLGVPIRGYHEGLDPTQARELDEAQLGVEVDIFILAIEPANMEAQRRDDERLFLELRSRTHVDEVLLDEVLIYLQGGD